MVHFQGRHSFIFRPVGQNVLVLDRLHLGSQGLTDHQGENMENADGFSRETQGFP